MRPPPLVLVTDPRWPLTRTLDVVRRAGGALARSALADERGGTAFVVQLRDKESSSQALLDAARALRAATREVAALLVVNVGAAGAWDVAAAVAADGVHLPGGACSAGAVARARAELGPEAFVSAAAHTDDDVAPAARAGASAILVSPVFDSPGKGPARGLDALRAARAIADAEAAGGAAAAVYALGGVDAAVAPACRAAGADGVAVIRALLDAADPAACARALAAPWGLSGSP